MPESSPAACRFAIRDNAAFCFLPTGLLNIDSALTIISFAGRDDADGFFFAMFTLHAIYVDYQQNCPLYGANGVPSLLAVDDSIFAERCMGIVEDQGGGLKRDTVLLLVDPVLLGIPFKSHRYTNCITLHRDSRSGNAPPWIGRWITEAADCEILAVK
jgi:hypothetical protein